MPHRVIGPALKEVGAALSRRVGTGFATFLMAQGIPPDLTHQFIVALGVVLGLGFDLSLSLYDRRRR